MKVASYQRSKFAVGLACAAVILGVYPSAQADTYTYSGTTGNTAGTPVVWSSGANWNAAPVSAVNTTLAFTGALATNTTHFTDNDLAGSFQLNQLTATYSGSGAVVTISGNPLAFANDGATTPSITVAGTGSVRPITNISSGIAIPGDMTITGNGRVNLIGPMTMVNAVPRTLTIAGSLAAGASTTNKSSIQTAISDQSAGNPTSILKQGASFWQLPAANTYTGTTTIEAGVLQSTVAEGLGTSSISVTGAAATVSLFGSKYSNNIFITGSGATVTPGTVDATVGAIWLGSGTEVAGTVTLQGNSRISTSTPTVGSAASITGKLTGAGDLFLGTNAGARNHGLVISNTANDYAGKTTIAAGGTSNQFAFTVGLGNHEVIPHGANKGNLELLGSSGAVATLDLAGFDETINGLSAPISGLPQNRVVINSSGANPSASTLTVGANDATASYFGRITNGSGNRLVALTKIGGGTQTLLYASTYTGDTTIEAGTLELDFNRVATNSNTAVSNFLSASSKLVLDGGRLAIQGREDGIAYAETLDIMAGTNITLASTAGLAVGQKVSGSGIPANAFIATINGNTITLNAAASAGTGVALTIEAGTFSTSQAFAQLELSASSSLDFGTAGETATISFGGVLQGVDGTVLTIDNWAGTPGVAGGPQRLLFDGVPTDFTSLFQQSEVFFTGFGSGYNAVAISGSQYEVTAAIPEPGSVVMLAGMTLAAMARRRVVRR